MAREIGGLAVGLRERVFFLSNTAIVAGFLAAICLLTSVYPAFQVYENTLRSTSILLYLGANGLSIRGGGLIKEFPLEEMTWLNAVIHRREVYLINSSAVVGILGYVLLKGPVQILTQPVVYIPVSVLIAFGAVHLFLSVTKRVHSHTFWARYISALGRGLKLTCLVSIGYPPLLAPTILLSAIGCIFAYFSLRQDQSQFHWEDH